MLGRCGGVCPTDTSVLMERLFWTHRFISEVSSSFQLLLLCCYKSSLTDSALLIQVYILSSAQSARTHTDAHTKLDECHSVDGWRITAGVCVLTSLCLFKAMRSQYFVDWAASHVCSHSCTSAVLEDKQELKDRNSQYRLLLMNLHANLSGYEVSPWENVATAATCSSGHLANTNLLIAAQL